MEENQIQNINEVQKEATQLNKIFVSIALLCIVAAMMFAYRLTENREFLTDEGFQNRDTSLDMSEHLGTTTDTYSGGVFGSDEVLQEVTFEAGLLEIGPDSSYIRASIKGKGAYSIQITPNTKILLNGEPVSITSFDPLTKVAITAKLLPDTEMYDYEAETISLTQTSKEKLEEETVGTY